MKSALDSADSRIRRRENSSRRMRRGRRAGNFPTKFMPLLRWAIKIGGKPDRSARSSSGATAQHDCDLVRGQKSGRTPARNFLQKAEVSLADGYTSPASLPERVPFGCVNSPAEGRS